MIGVWHSVLAAKGDVFVRTAVRDVRLPVGTNGQALIADSTQTAGVKWGNGGGPTVFITGNPNVAVGAELLCPGGDERQDDAGRVATAKDRVRKRDRGRSPRPLGICLRESCVGTELLSAKECDVGEHRSLVHERA